MKSSRWVRMGLLSLTLGCAGSVLMAQAGPGAGPGFGPHRPPMERALGPWGGHGRLWNNPDVVAKLGLTDAQRKQMDGILDQHRLKLVDLRGNVKKAELNLEPLMKADPPDEGRIVSQIDQVAQARAELEKANARFLLEIRGKLTAEQWKQLQAMRAERKDHEMGGCGHDGHRGDGNGRGGDGANNWGARHGHDGGRGMNHPQGFGSGQGGGSQGGQTAPATGQSPSSGLAPAAGSGPQGISVNESDGSELALVDELDL